VVSAQPVSDTFTFRNRIVCATLNRHFDGSEENNMKKKATSRFVVLAGTALFSPSLSTGAWAADVNKLVEDCTKLSWKRWRQHR
jgi:hypothetical protein